MINRKQFIRSIFGLGLTSGLLGYSRIDKGPLHATKTNLNAQNLKANTTQWEYTNVAGVQYHIIPEYLHKIQADDIINLQREPYNPYDKEAIAIYHKGTKIGYIPAHDTEYIRDAITQEDHPMVGLISYIDPYAHPWEAIEVSVPTIYNFNTDAVPCVLSTIF